MILSAVNIYKLKNRLFFWKRNTQTVNMETETMNEEDDDGAMDQVSWVYSEDYVNMDFARNTCTVMNTGQQVRQVHEDINTDAAGTSATMVMTMPVHERLMHEVRGFVFKNRMEEGMSDVTTG